jgi:hypothetical protein
MASELEETLYSIFAGLAGGIGGGGIGGSLASAAAGGSKASNDGGGGAARAALSVVKNGLGVVPAVAALFGLFGGDDEEKPAPPAKYALPERREFHAAVTASGLAETDYDQSGMPRVYERRVFERAAAVYPERRPEERGGLDMDAERPAVAAPQIHVNVQAMDARSFLDRSSEIAAAVREAMLNLNSINDVVQDL